MVNKTKKAAPKAKTTSKAKAVTNVVKEVDVTTRELHAVVQCEDVRLITSSLKPLIVDENRDISTRFAFRVRATIEKKKAFSYLEVKVNYFFREKIEGLQGFNLSYVLMGTFTTESNLAIEDFAHFIKMYTVSILWPYAREFASDQFRRAGNYDVILPIVNPQLVTEHIIENNLVEVEIIDS